MKYPNRVAVNGLFFVGMCALFVAEWYACKTNPLGGFYGVVAGVLLLNTLAWGEQ